MRIESLLIAFLLLLGLPVNAQLFSLCCEDRCDAFEVNPMNQLELYNGRGLVGGLSYPLASIDSIVFCQPDLPIRELGWQRGENEGTYYYNTPLSLKDSVMGELRCDVQFTIQFANGICTAACCEVTLEDDSMSSFFLEEATIGGNTDANSDEYIYVKLTQTGPRKREIWMMQDPVLPAGIQWYYDGNLVLQADCSELLAGRSMGDIRKIVEAWVHQKPEKMAFHDFLWYEDDD